MTRDRPPSGSDRSDPRRARLAEALRANLRRRKDAARAGETGTEDPAPSAPSAPEDDPSRETGQ